MRFKVVKGILESNSPKKFKTDSDSEMRPKISAAVISATVTMRLPWCQWSCVPNVGQYLEIQTAVCSLLFEIVARAWQAESRRLFGYLDTVCSAVNVYFIFKHESYYVCSPTYATLPIHLNPLEPVFYEWAVIEIISQHPLLILMTFI